MEHSKYHLWTVFRPHHHPEMFCFGEKTVWQWQDTSKKELGLQNLRGCCLGWLGLARIRAGCTAPSLTERFCKKILRKLWQKSACIQKSDCIYNCCDQPWMGSLEGWGGGKSVSRSLETEGGWEKLLFCGRTKSWKLDQNCSEIRVFS